MLCRVLGVSTSGYYAWRGRKPSLRARQDVILREHIVRIHQESRGTYGSPRIHAEMAMGLQIRCSKKRVARLMCEAGIEGVHRRRRRGITRRDASRTPAPDLVQHQFAQKAPNRHWVADMTQHRTDVGWRTPQYLNVHSWVGLTNFRLSGVAPMSGRSASLSLRPLETRVMSLNVARISSHRTTNQQLLPAQRRPALFPRPLLSKRLA